MFQPHTLSRKHHDTVPHNKHTFQVSKNSKKRQLIFIHETTKISPQIWHKQTSKTKCLPLIKVNWYTKLQQTYWFTLNVNNSYTKHKNLFLHRSWSYSITEITVHNILLQTIFLNLICLVMVTKTENVLYTLNMLNNHISRVLTDGILLYFQFIYQ